MKAAILYLETVEEENGYSIKLVPETQEEEKLLGVTFETWANKKSKNMSVYYHESRIGKDTESLTLDLICKKVNSSEKGSNLI